MHIGLLLCDRVRPELLDVSGDYPEMFEAMFQRYAPQVTLSVFDVRAGEYPQSIDDCDAYISSGSAASVYENDAWIKDFEAYLQTLHQAKKKFIGVCFGHQMMARALGTTVAPSNKGWGIGIKTCQIIRHKPWMQPSTDQYTILVSHRDQVARVPAGAELLATSTHCENAMFQVGDHFLGLQGHPEFTPAYARALMDARAAIIPSDCRAAAHQSLATPLNTQILIDWIIAFIRSQ